MKDCHDKSKANSKHCQVGGKFFNRVIILIKSPTQTLSLPCVYPYPRDNGKTGNMTLITVCGYINSALCLNVKKSRFCCLCCARCRPYYRRIKSFKVIIDRPSEASIIRSFHMSTCLLHIIRLKFCEAVGCLEEP